MKKVEKARELIEKHGFSRNSYETCEQYEQYEKTYNVRYSSCSWVKKVIVTIGLYTDEDDAEYAEANIEYVTIDDCEDLTDLKCIQDAIKQAVADIEELEELQDEINDLEGDKENKDE